MSTNETKRKLGEMRLHAIVEALQIQDQNSQYQSMTFEDCFDLIVEVAYARQQSNRLTD